MLFSSHKVGYILCYPYAGIRYHPSSISLMDKIESKIFKAKVSYMSNAKWRKLFTACEDYSADIGGTLWKFIGHPTPIESSLCAANALLDNERFADCLPAPYACLREIEWVFIPSIFENPHSDKKRPLPKLNNDISAIKEHLSKYSKFPVIEGSNGIKIIGYEW